MTHQTIFLTAALPWAAAVGVVVWDRLRTRRVLRHLDDMLERAIRGDFTEDTFDESLLSSVETKLAHYLSASAVSARGLQAEKDKIKTLISDISHQTKTPIANIQLYAQLLSEQELPPDSRACVAALESQAEKLRSLIDALVKTSRLETGALVLNPRHGPLQPMLAAAAEQFVPRAEEKGIALILEPTEDSALFDPKWTEEAVCNLLDNAVKYTPSGGTVTVRARSYELFVRVDVADTGMGVPEGEQSKIFQRFYRSPSVCGVQGVGIGLYLVRQIAAGQGGYVKLASTPGQGSTFSLFLPRS